MERHALLTEAETRALLANGIAVLIGFLLKVVQDWKRDKLTVKSVLIQLVSSLGVCYFVWKASFSVGWIGKHLEIILGLASLCSAQIVTSAETLGREGLKGFIRKKINELGGSNHGNVPDSPAD